MEVEIRLMIDRLDRFNPTVRQIQYTKGSFELLYKRPKDIDVHKKYHLMPNGHADSCWNNGGILMSPSVSKYTECVSRCHVVEVWREL